MSRKNVRTWMTPFPVQIGPEETIIQAYSLMKRHRIRRLPVIEGGRLIGIITINDIRSTAPMGELTLMADNHLLAHMPVRRAMTPDPITISPDAHVSEAARILMKHKFGGLPVVENDQLVGIISEADIFRHTIAESWSPEDSSTIIDGEEHLNLWDGTALCIRPITSEDTARLQHSHEQLSQETIYDRFMGFRKILPDDEARYLTGLDYDTHMALVATTSIDDQEVIIGVARYIRIQTEPGVAEFAIVVGDPYQRRGLGSILMKRLSQYAAAHDVDILLGLTHTDNIRFLRWVKKLGFPIETKKSEGIWEVRLSLAELKPSHDKKA